jgi:hypothetical protein
MQSEPSPEHPDYTSDRTSPLRVSPAVADLNRPYANRRRNRRTITWSSHQWESGDKPDSCGLHLHALASGSAKHPDSGGDKEHSSRHGLEPSSCHAPLEPSGPHCLLT